jgi:aminopeptidase
MAGSSEDQVKRLAQFELKMMKDAACYIGIRGAGNIFETSGVPREKVDAFDKHFYKPVHLEQRVKRTRWCVMRYPTPSMAQLAEKSTDDFADFYYDVCCIDYAKMAKAVLPLKKRMDAAKVMRFTGPGTDLTMTKDGIPSVPCTGSHNIPDGECFTAPARESVNGTVHFNCATTHDGHSFDFVDLVFKNGKVVDARAANDAQTKALNQILDQDKGARYLGEVALGFNPSVLEPMRDTLFDEKIAGSFHMALGQCYDSAPNGNKSALHWDLVCIQRPEHGGGEIHFDGKCIRRDGMFVVKDLMGLNPDAFKI